MFQKLMNTFDLMTETIMHYVDKAVLRLENSDQKDADAGDKSVLEKLLLIDRRIAIVMAFDMILAGVDTVIPQKIGTKFDWPFVEIRL